MHAADFTAGRRLVQSREACRESAKAIAARLFKAERSLETSALDMNDLHTGLIEGRRAAGLSPSVGQQLIDETAQAQMAVTHALAALSRLHAAAGRQVEDLGLPRMDFGAGGGKPGGQVADFDGGA